MVNSLPRVFIVIPAYNAQKTIKRALESVLRQKSINVHTIIVDHGSKDDTVQLLKSFRHHDNITLINLQRYASEVRSASRPLSVGMGYVLLEYGDQKNAWVMRLDTDDFLASDTSLSDMLTSINNNSIDLCYGLLAFYDPIMRTAHLYGPSMEYRAKEKLIQGGAYALGHHSTLIRMTLLDSLLKNDGYFYDQAISYGEDLDFTLRLLRTTVENPLFVENLIVYKFRGSDTMTSTAGIRRIWRDHQYIFKKHPQLPSWMLRRVGVDLVLQLGGKYTSRLRPGFGLPAWQVGFEKPIDYETIQRRLIEITLL